MIITIYFKIICFAFTKWGQGVGYRSGFLGHWAHEDLAKEALKPQDVKRSVERNAHG